MRTRTVDPILAKSYEVPKLWKRAFSAKHRVMVMVICRLRAEGRMAKDRISYL
jgi:hypothetical protein